MYKSGKNKGLLYQSNMIRITALLFCAVATLASSTPPLPRPSIHVDGGNSGSGKIIHGVNANQGQFPYIVSLNYVGDGHACGASILTPSWILTAGHCCLTGSPTYIYTSSILLSSGGLSFDIVETRVHPNYDPDNYWHNDICLIRINGNIPLGPNAQQVSLAAQGTEVPDNAPVVIPGWGYTTSSAPQNIPDRLQVVTRYFARSPANCQSATNVPNFAGHICAIGQEGQAVCQGDSGGPLTYNGVQVGITSFVFLPCAETGLPDYFTRVSNYIPWIQENLGAEASLLNIVSL